MIYGLETVGTLLLAVVSFIIVIGAQIYLTSTYGENKKKKNQKGLTGCEAARKILDSNGLNNIYVVEVKGELSDHYDPSRKVVRLSSEIFHGDSIASLAIAAHECGHAIQDKDNYTFMRIRGTLAPVVNLVTYLGYFGLIISLFAGITGYLMISIGLIVVALVFQLITLPVEFDASKRALVQIDKLLLIEPSEKSSAEKMLKAAAYTYVASLVSLVLDLLRLVIMTRDRD
jgi:Zn-dependent membrane protease YugP